TSEPDTFVTRKPSKHSVPSGIDRTNDFSAGLSLPADTHAHPVDRHCHCRANAATATAWLRVTLI
ncbi:MAG: hypothetical protein AAFO75_10935, partial [Pseudomonadota bacterium]